MTLARSPAAASISATSRHPLRVGQNRGHDHTRSVDTRSRFQPRRRDSCTNALQKYGVYYGIRSQPAYRNQKQPVCYTDPFFIVPGELTNVAKKRKVLKKKTAPARKATAIKKKTAPARKTAVVKKKAPSARSTTAVKTRQGNEGSRDQATEFFRRARAARFFPTS